MRAMQTKSSKQNNKLSSNYPKTDDFFFENYNIKRQTLNEIWDPINKLF